jgi:hypothetical protein
MNSRLQSTHSEILECATEQSQGLPAARLPELSRSAQSAQAIQLDDPQENPRLSDQSDKPALAMSPCCGCCGG